MVMHSFLPHDPFGGVKLVGAFPYFEVQNRLAVFAAGEHRSELLFDAHGIAHFHQYVLQIGIDREVLSVAENDRFVCARNGDHGRYLALVNRPRPEILIGSDVDAVVHDLDVAEGRVGVFSE